MELQQHTETLTTATAKLLPPATVLGAQIAGVQVDDAIKWLTFTYIALLVIHKLWVMGREFVDFWGPRMGTLGRTLENAMGYLDWIGKVWPAVKTFLLAAWTLAKRLIGR